MLSTATALATWLAATYGPTQGVLDELEDANKVALCHLKKYHKADDPVLEQSRKLDAAWELIYTAGHARFRVEVRGKHSLILRGEQLDAH